MQWIEVPNTSRKNVPAWQRSAGLADDGTVFVPAAIAGNEEAAVLSASWDGVGVVLYKKHAFLPAGWIAQEHPTARELCGKIERKVREACASDD
jgi:hypothetical protein